MATDTIAFPVRDVSKELKDWLHRCYSTNGAHGAALVEAWLCADNVSRSCRVLDQLVDAGWLLPGEFSTPSFEMTFFGVGGRPGGVKSKGEWRASHTYACEFHFTPNYDSADFMAWLRE